MAEKKKFRGSVRIGVNEDGKPIYKWVTADTRRDLENAKVAIREHYVYGAELPKDLPFYEYAEEWYRLKKEPFISDASKVYYRSAFMKHILPEFGLQNMKAISATQLQEFVNGYNGKSKSQINLVIGILKGIFSSAYAEGVIERDPTVALIRPKPTEHESRRPLTPEETEGVLKTIETHPEGLFLGVLYYLGVRRGEALGLKWGDFDFEESQVHIQRDIDFTHSVAKEDTLKTKAADRYIPVSPALADMLLTKKGEPDGLVFPDGKGNPMSQATFKRMWCRLMLAAGCTDWREVDETTLRPADILKNVKPTLTPHYFRHNYATLLYEAGVDPLMAMKILGHTDYQTTANIYTHIRDEMLKKATVNMAEVFDRRAVK